MGFSFRKKGGGGSHTFVMNSNDNNSKVSTADSYASIECSTISNNDSRCTMISFSDSQSSGDISNDTRTTATTSSTSIGSRSTMMSNLSNNSRRSDALLMSEATNQALLAAKAILNAGGSDATALKTARAAAFAHLVPESSGHNNNNNNNSITDQDGMLNSSGVGISFLRRRKLKRQADVVASMALGSALANSSNSSSSTRRGGGSISNAGSYCGSSITNSHNTHTTAEEHSTASSDWDRTMSMCHDHDNINHTNKNKNDGAMVRPSVSEPTPFTRPVGILKKNGSRSSSVCTKNTSSTTSGRRVNSVSQGNNKKNSKIRKQNVPILSSNIVPTHFHLPEFKSNRSGISHQFQKSYSSGLAPPSSRGTRVTDTPPTICNLFSSADIWLPEALSDSDSMETDFFSALEDGSALPPPRREKIEPNKSFIQAGMDSVMSSVSFMFNCGSEVPNEVKIPTVHFNEQVSFSKDDDIPNVISITSTKEYFAQSESEESSTSSSSSASSSKSTSDEIMRKMLAKTKEINSTKTPRSGYTVVRPPSIQEVIDSVTKIPSMSSPSKTTLLPSTPPPPPPPPLSSKMSETSDPVTLPTTSASTYESSFEEFDENAQYIEIFTVPSRNHRFTRKGYNQLRSPEPQSSSSPKKTSGRQEPFSGKRRLRQKTWRKKQRMAEI